ncbi:MAG TPA: bifunctional diaminohydroxyphosphoribosylaminopyrimidine deaminase/5-amino-6-(5-phosphoribosylamino)uracil reductase RibD [Hypericibacter adhaerens]|uniref:bifunctional diaminohydroxyphosphoribosylaminopyrimidine deaminase/5-amino-6-(5-phosphoribosylamino)uracil reductase RibD n=1 Tax=Hypericibacter adhaerens TaxID=2602016 RepID=UPI002D140511|nr:bifunctional diaminohydroxyphosphoribosylaminopyrimidine deaminase/5-amino-6-(5-phosphoribosylamino)uracil reductase RibD [Hypericibacter adhaerens]HWA42085.1 bifunctional diaminohydroxyphosphoribosylaminopyrimidine deaminase/5-amino-6-(5-phosphoribosylamino)uracil reductase RibD [Hypericibacter adhaerens]
MKLAKSPKPTDTDIAHMRAALTLAARGLGRVWPNPAVGCVLVAPEGRVIARGWTQPGGRPHAEVEALRRAGAAAKGATAYVSLEPCSHHGQTPPCAEALVAAGIERCVAAIEDPDPRVQGRGLAKLRAAGIAVTLGPLQDEAADLNAGFFSRVRLGRPLVTLKIASTLDGRIALAGGESRWITGEASRARVHLMRAQHDAVLVGGATALADDPELTVRLPGLEDRRPVRIVLDRDLALPPSAKLVVSGDVHPSWIVVGPDVADARKESFRKAGAELIEVPLDKDGRLDLQAVLKALAGRGLTRLLVEGGGRLAASLLAQDLVDRLAWFRSPGIIGGDGIPAAGPLSLASLTEMPRFQRIAAEPLGADLLESYKRRS